MYDCCVLICMHCLFLVYVICMYLLVAVPAEAGAHSADEESAVFLLRGSQARTNISFVPTNHIPYNMYLQARSERNMVAAAISLNPTVTPCNALWMWMCSLTGTRGIPQRELPEPFASGFSSGADSSMRAHCSRGRQFRGTRQ